MAAIASVLNATSPTSATSVSTPSSATTHPSSSTSGNQPHICHTCKQPILETQFIRVQNFKFHKEHFTCSVCSDNLHGNKFHHKDSQFYCTKDYINKFCLAEGTLVALADGTTRPIESLAGEHQVWSWQADNCLHEHDHEQHAPHDESSHGAGKPAIAYNHSINVISQGLQPCIQLTLADNRTLTCTADHRIQTQHGWVEADQLAVDGSDRIMMGLDLPLDVLQDDSHFISLHSFAAPPPVAIISPRSLRMRSQKSRPHFTDRHTLVLPNSDVEADVRSTAGRQQAHAFARLLGSKTTSAHTRNAKRHRVLHRIDYTQMQQDCSLLAPPTAQAASSTTLIPALLQSDIDAITSTSASSTCNIADTLTQLQYASKSFTREFLASLFGQHATAPQPSTPHACDATSSCHSHNHDDAQWAPIQLQLSIDNAEILQHLLRQYKIDAQLTADSDDITTLSIPPSSFSNFAQSIGYRYATQKQMQLTIAVSHLQSQSTLSPSAYIQHVDAAAIFESAESSGYFIDNVPTWYLQPIARQDAGQRQTYDLTVPITHNFLANGLVVHNCHTCRHCNQKITNGSVIQAFGSYYHPEHFVCTVCGVGFTNGKYYEVEDSPYCEEHYFAIVGERCTGCSSVVLEQDLVRVQNKPWHAKCLVCAHCGIALAKAVDKNAPTANGRDLDAGSIFHKDNSVYCKADYLDLFCKRCSGCGDHILKHCISVNEELYHPACLICDICQKKLNKYICIQGHLRCSEHTETPCSKFECFVCHKTIEGDVILAVGKKIHPECFKCAYCNSQLAKPHAKMKNNKLCCQSCIMIKDLGNTTQRSNSSSLAATQRALSTSTQNSIASTQPPSTSRKLSASSSTDGLSDKYNDNDSDAGSEPATGRSKTKSSSTASSKERKKLSVNKAASANQTSGFASIGTSQSITNSMQSNGDHSRGKSTAGMNGNGSSSGPNPNTRGSIIEWKKGELIGKGSFGKVYMGMNAATGELIAVKVVRLNTEDEIEQAKAIENEIGLMENLRHPNIVALLGTQRQGNKLNILMEYVPGKSLDTLLEKFGAFSEKVIRSYTRQLLEALCYCHANRVVHRDIKGKNILIDTKGNLKLADFGSAKLLATDINQPSLSYNYTPLWTAPEVLTGDYNNRVDVWSLGCVIIEMATAKPPWSEYNFENPFRALYHIGNSDAIPNIPKTVSDLGRTFILECLQRDPEKRPEAAQLLQHEWVQGLDDEEESEDHGSDLSGSEEEESDSDTDSD